MNIKFNVLTSLTLSVFFISFNAMNTQIQPKQFKQSKEQDINEYVCFFTHFKLSTETPIQIKNKMLSSSFVLNHKNRIFYLPEYCSLIKSTTIIETLKDIQKSFDKLKRLMQIPDEVKIMFYINQLSIPDGAMSYSSTDRTILLYPSILISPPSFILFSLIHELTHVKQHIRNGFLNLILTQKDQIEREADVKAALTIKCPSCLNAIMTKKLKSPVKLTEVEQLSRSKEYGYLTAGMLLNFKNAADKKDLCDSHKQKETNEDEDQQKILETDFLFRSIYDRLSTIKVTQD